MQTEGFEILLVEDNESDAHLAIRALKKHGLASRLMWVKDGVEAIDFLLSRGAYQKRDMTHKPKVILLDLVMPKINGHQVLENVRRHEELKDIPVIIMTASQEEQERYKSQMLGVNAFLVKPIKIDNFIQAIKEVELYWYFFNEPPTPTG